MPYLSSTDDHLHFFSSTFRQTAFFCTGIIICHVITAHATLLQKWLCCGDCLKDSILPHDSSWEAWSLRYNTDNAMGIMCNLWSGSQVFFNRGNNIYYMCSKVKNKPAYFCDYQIIKTCDCQIIKIITASSTIKLYINIFCSWMFPF